MFLLNDIASPKEKYDPRSKATPTLFRVLDTVGLLKQFHYRASYSHRGRYYTLTSAPVSHNTGCACQGACFSRYGTLLATVESLNDKAPAGCLATEVDAPLGVGCGDACRVSMSAATSSTVLPSRAARPSNSPCAACSEPRRTGRCRHTR